MKDKKILVGQDWTDGICAQIVAPDALLLEAPHTHVAWIHGVAKIALDLSLNDTKALIKVLEEKVSTYEQMEAV